MKDFIRERLLEALKSRHWNQESYPIRIEDSRYGGEDGIPLRDVDVQTIDKNIKVVESLEFSKDGMQKIGVWLYDAPKDVFYPPFQRRDKGRYLLAIINNNTMTTMYWKHKYEGQYDYDITYNNLVEFAQSEFYDAKTNPITIRNIEAWVESKLPKREPKAPPTANVNRFKKLKLTDGTVVRYYKLLNKFETLDGVEIKLDDIFEKLPEELQDVVINLM